MANILRKLISGIAAAAILSTMAVAPVAAEEIILDEDYTVGGADASSWTEWAESGVNTAITGEGLALSTSGSTKGQRYLGIPVTVTGSVAVEYDVKVQTPKGPSTIWLGSKPRKVDGDSPSIASISVNAGAGTGKVNGKAVSYPGASSNTTPWLHVTQIVNADAKEIITTVKTASETIYDDTDNYLSDEASFTAFGVSVARGDGGTSQVTFKNLKISSVNVPVIALEDINRIEVGKTEPIATVTGTEDISVELTDDVNFTYSIDGNTVSIEANADAVQGATTTAKITAVGEVEVHKSITVTALTAQEIVEAALEEIELSGDTVIKDGDVYNVLGSFEVPISNGAVSISWESDSSAIAIDTGAVRVTGTGRVVLKATASYNGAEDSKEFTLVIPTNKVYYNEDFSTIPAGTYIVDIGFATTTNTTNGMTFETGTRNNQNDHCIHIGVFSDSNNYNDCGNHLEWIASNYNYDAEKDKKNTRPQSITFDRMKDAAIRNKLHINFDINIGYETSSLEFSDGIKTLTISAPELGVETNKWYNVNIDVNTETNEGLMTVKDSNGELVKKAELSGAISNLTKISSNGGNDIKFLIDNLVIADAVIPSITQKEDTVILGESAVIASVQDADTVDIEVSNPSAFTAEYDKEKGDVTVTAIGEDAASTTITVTADNSGITTKETYTISSINAAAVTRAALAQNSVYYAADKKGEVISPVIADGAVIFNDMVLPSKETVELNGFSYTADVAWEVTSGDNLAADGTISAADKSEHEAVLKKTVKYMKNGEAKSTDSAEYKLKVKFDNDEVLDTVNKALTAAGIAEDAAEAYRKSFVYDYQVKFDEAYASNFSSVPETVKENITLPAKGYFGSNFTWNSTVPTVISNQGKFVKPTSDKKVSLTVTIEAGKAKKEKTIDVKAQGSGTGGGGSTSSSGTTSRPNSSASVASAGTGGIAGSPAANGGSIVDKLLEEKDQANDKFKDIKDAIWAREAINALAEKGIVNGVTDTEFAPNSTVTRAQFAKMLMGAFGFTANAYSTSSFRDISTSDWSFQYVEAAYNLGIINGVEEGRFAPNALITRQDMAVMVSRAAAVSGKKIAEVREGMAFADNGSISAYAKDAVDELVKGGIINGISDTEFAPKSNATRAQAAKILFGVL